MLQTRKAKRCFQCVFIISLSVSEGVQCKLLEFYEDRNETANGIHQALMYCLEKHELDIRNKSHTAFSFFFCYHSGLGKWHQYFKYEEVH